MRITLFTKLLFAVLVLSGLFLTSQAFALQLDYPDWFKPVFSLSAGLTGIVGSIYNIFLVIAGATAFIVMVYAGFRYLTSAGNPSTMADARNQIFSALLGLALLTGSYLILNTINPELVELQEPGIKPVKAPVLKGTIAVSVEQPIDAATSKTLAARTGAHDFPLQGSLKLIVDTDNMTAKLQAEHADTGDPLGVVPPWEKELKSGKNISLKKTYTMDDAKDLPVGTDVSVEFTIAMGGITGKPGEIVIEFDEPMKSLGQNPWKHTIEVKNLTRLTEEINVPYTGGALKIIIEPGNRKIKLGVGIPNIWCCKDIWKKDVKKDSLDIDTKIPEEIETHIFGKQPIPLIGGMPIKGKIGIGAWPGSCEGGNFAVWLYKEPNCSASGGKPGKPDYCLRKGERTPLGPKDVQSFVITDSTAGVWVWSKENYGAGKDHHYICFNQSHADMGQCKKKSAWWFLKDDYWNNDWLSVEAVDSGACIIQNSALPRTTYDQSGSEVTGADKCLPVIMDCITP